MSDLIEKSRIDHVMGLEQKNKHLEMQTAKAKEAALKWTPEFNANVNGETQRVEYSLRFNGVVKSISVPYETVLQTDPQSLVNALVDHFYKESIKDIFTDIISNTVFITSTNVAKVSKSGL